MAAMSNAPLCYTLAMVRFPRIINTEKFVGAFQERVKERFPLLDECSNQGIEIESGASGPNIRMVSEKTWQFSDLERGHAIILGHEFIVLHAGVKYGGHEDFISRFGYAVDALQSIDGLSSVMTALGYRYVDVVASGDDENDALDKYLQAWTMPTSNLGLSARLKLIDSVFVAGFRTPGGVMRFQCLRNPPTTLPPELDSEFVRRNGWILPRPATDFVLLDIDHASVLSSPLAIDMSVVKRELKALRDPATELFKSAVTPHALHVWQ